MTDLGDRTPPLGGWLLILCALLLVWGPLTLSLVTANTLPALSVRGPSLALLLLARIAVAAFGIAAGIAMMARRRPAVSMAKVALILSASIDLLIYTTPYFPSNRVPGDTPFHVAASLAYHAVWLTYLFRSKRVKDTYG